jgi:hypothetical protein
MQGIGTDLEAMGLPAQALTGREVMDLLNARFDPETAEAWGLPASFLRPEAVAGAIAGEHPSGAAARAGALAQAICTAPVSLTQRSHLQVGGSREQVLHVALPPEQTWLGWLLHLTQAPLPFTLSVHVQATERRRSDATSGCSASIAASSSAGARWTPTPDLPRPRRPS